MSYCLYTVTLYFKKFYYGTCEIITTSVYVKNIVLFIMQLLNKLTMFEHNLVMTRIFKYSFFWDIMSYVEFVVFVI